MLISTAAIAAQDKDLVFIIPTKKPGVQKGK